MIEIAHPLTGKKGLVLGIVNGHSITYGCAKAFRALGADLAITYLNDKAKPFGEPLVKELDASIFLPTDVRLPGQLEAAFESIRQTFGKLNCALHAIAFAPNEELHSRLTDRSRDGLLQAMGVSCHSFIRMARLAEPLMHEGGRSVHDELLRRGKSH